MSLQPIQFGTLASSEQVNDNFEYLDGRITETASEIAGVESNLRSQIETQVGNLSGVTSLSNSFKTLLVDALYPVGTTYCTTQNTTVCPLASITGTWELVASGKALWTGTGSNGGTTIAESLPNHRHSYYAASKWGADAGSVGANWCRGDSSAGATATGYFTYASADNSIYNGSHVQPAAYVVNVFRRTA